ncbi:MAG: hypothetical protein ACJ8F7_22925 [Gemmataceae bacterium]
MTTRTRTLVLAFVLLLSGSAAGQPPAILLPPTEPLPPPQQQLVPAPVPWQVAPPPPGFGDPVSPAEAALCTPGRWGFEVGANLAVPIIHQNLQAPVTVGNLYTTTVQLPSADQDLGGGLFFNISYALGPGDLSATYRFFVSDGRQTLVGFDPVGPADLVTRLSLNTVDLDYSLRRQLGARWTARLDIGAKLGSAYFDTFADSPQFSDHISNSFFGAGPHAALALTRTLSDSNLALFGRVDFGTLFGDVHQHFAEAAYDLNGNFLASGHTDQHVTRGIPVLQVQLGLGGAPWGGRWGRWQAGYEFEQWWGLGQVGQSTGDLTLHGFFARYTFKY